MADASNSATNNKDSIKNTLIVAVSLCLVSAIIVSGSAVLLKPQRMENKALFRNKNILIAAGLYQKGETADSEISGLFKNFEIRMVDLEQNKLLSASDLDALGIDISKYNQRKAAKNPDTSKALSTADDIASISRRAQYSVVYLLKKDNKIEKAVLPIHGYGLWSTLYGFIALESDLNTVAGITFYEHGETAGLGGEIENPRWKANWVGKYIYSNDGKVRFTVMKGAVDPKSKNAIHEVDGLSGASLTARGVQNLITYWLGSDGFGPVLEKIRG
ncbi:MAG: Na(+)-translocating NADH-quinone reductase subunit C [Pseudomonadales bacterium]|nr:Na(+)-translocating NADH-quinone reductase subunit C [Pseudomonadales bacterium]